MTSVTVIRTMEVEEMVRNKGARFASLVAVGVLAFGALAACGGSDSDGGSDGRPAAAAGQGQGRRDPARTRRRRPRWEANDRPSLKKAFDDAGIESDIQNAGGDKAKFGRSATA